MALRLFHPSTSLNLYRVLYLNSGRKLYCCKECRLNLYRVLYLNNGQIGNIKSRWQIEPIQSVVFKSGWWWVCRESKLNLYRVLYLNIDDSLTVTLMLSIEPIQSVVFKYSKLVLVGCWNWWLNLYRVLYLNR